MKPEVAVGALKSAEFRDLTTEHAPISDPDHLYWFIQGSLGNPRSLTLQALYELQLYGSEVLHTLFCMSRLSMLSCCRQLYISFGPFASYCNIYTMYIAKQAVNIICT